MTNLNYLITGCGRSGTGFLAGLVNSSGKKCGHEEIFDVYGINTHSEVVYESSWYAVPHLHCLNPTVKILHIVRNPIDVINSFYRIGLVANSKIYHITGGRRLRYFLKNAVTPVSVLDRFAFVTAHREFLLRSSNIFDFETEFKRLECYWREWNTKISKFGSSRSHHYLCVRLEDYSERKSEIFDFLELNQIEYKNKPRNIKPFYKERKLMIEKFEPQTICLMEKYGYSQYRSFS